MQRVGPPRAITVSQSHNQQCNLQTAFHRYITGSICYSGDIRRRMDSYIGRDQRGQPVAMGQGLSPRATTPALIGLQSTRHLVEEYRYPGQINTTKRTSLSPFLVHNDGRTASCAVSPDIVLLVGVTKRRLAHACGLKLTGDVQRIKV